MTPSAIRAAARTCKRTCFRHDLCAFGSDQKFLEKKERVCRAIGPYCTLSLILSRLASLNYDL